MDLTRTSMADAEVKYLNLEKQLQRTTQELRAQLEEEQDAFHQERTRIEADTTAVHSEHEAAVLEVRQLQEQLRNATDEIDDLKQLLDGASVRKVFFSPPAHFFFLGNWRLLWPTSQPPNIPHRTTTSDFTQTTHKPPHSPTALTPVHPPPSPPTLTTPHAAVALGVMPPLARPPHRTP